MSTPAHRATPPRHHAIPAVYVYLRRDNQVLLQFRQNTQFMNERWAAGAAGHVEASEGLVGAAIREAREELGITITTDNLIAEFCAYQRRDHPVDTVAEPERIDFIFSCWYWDGEPRVMEPRKAAGVRWFALENLPSDVSEYEAPLMRRLSSQPEPQGSAQGRGKVAFLDLTYDA